MKKNFLAVCIPAILALSGCATFPGWLPASGPSRERVEGSQEAPRLKGIQVVDVSDELARKLADSRNTDVFSKTFATDTPNNYVIGQGDVLQVTIWETPPAMLFSATTLVPSTAVPAPSNSVSLPPEMVAEDGAISIPFAGRIDAAGHTIKQIEASIVNGLRGKANQPQVLVSLVKDNASTVTIIGEVNTSSIMPITPKGERLLDALAFAAGAKQPTSHMAIRLSRGDVTATMPLDSIIRDPKQNVMLQPGDVLTALYQPETFSVLGATGKNDEIPLEAQGISLAQALARSGGIADNRADARGVFVFRYEDAKLVDNKDASVQPVRGRVPVVYEIDLRDPSSFFVTQNFPIENHDVIYVSNSPGAEFSKFLSYIVMVASPAAAINYDMAR